LWFNASLAIRVGVGLSARILIVDDYLVARTTIRSLLGWHSFEVCGDAKNGKEAIEKVIELKPDVVLLDLNMPVMNGIQAAYQIRQIAPSTKIIFFTIHEAPEFVGAMHTLGDAFVPKSAAGTELIPALNRLAGIAGGKPPERSTKSRRAARA
jgi:DNA-binding NarL/FixJ family response regulator